jgi:hypothetical protein
VTREWEREPRKWRRVGWLFGRQIKRIHKNKSWEIEKAGEGGRGEGRSYIGLREMEWGREKGEGDRFLGLCVIR